MTTRIPDNIKRNREGRKIADQPDQIKRIDNNWYQVKSQSLKYDSWYDVVRTGTVLSAIVLIISGDTSSASTL